MLFFFGSRVLPEGKATANQYKVVLDHHLYPVMKHSRPDENDLFQTDDGPIRSAPIMWITRCGLCSQIEDFALLCQIALTPHNKWNDSYDQCQVRLKRFGIYSLVFVSACVARRLVKLYGNAPSAEATITHLQAALRNMPHKHNIRWLSWLNQKLPQTGKEISLAAFVGTEKCFFVCLWQ